MPFIVAKTTETLDATIAAWRKEGASIAFVPTMGALHDGHLSLMERARGLADRLVVSIFVNPTQFAPGEDFERYPRPIEDDIAKLKELKADILFLPDVETMYPEGYVTNISVKGLNNILCGAVRPGHFDGVATVVARLFMLVKPEVAVFGEKDYQQLAIIRRMVTDLAIPVRVEGAPTLREPDGLAMSSRNLYLSKEERAIAAQIYAMLTHVATCIRQNPTHVVAVLAEGAAMLKNAGFQKVDYLELRDGVTLVPMNNLDRPARLLVAAHLGKTRLIDNVEVLPK